MLKKHDLANDRSKKHKQNHEIYKSILEQVYAKIRMKNSLGHSQMVYTISPIQPGKPLINVQHALMYICRKLQSGNFKTYVIHNVLNVDWS